MIRDMEHLYDMHCHLGSMPNADQVAKQAEQLGLVLLNVTVSPTDANGSARLNHHANVRAACGLHPWWIASGACGEEDIARARSVSTSAAGAWRPHRSSKKHSTGSSNLAQSIP